MTTASSITLDRRNLIAGALAMPIAASAAGPAFAQEDEETFWQGIASEYDVTREVIQLENGNWGMMPRPVQERYLDEVARVNRDTSYYARRGMWKDIRAIHEQLAGSLGVPPAEIAFTRNATEALKVLIGGYNRLEPGDSVLYADLDYDSMQLSMDSLARRKGASVVRITIPEAGDAQAIIDAYDAAFTANPGVRLALLTHISHRTGLVIPVREIARLARARGIDTIVDAAHSWCQLDFTLPDLDCDFVGLNGHKWLGAPLGVGILHIRDDALGKIDRDLASPPDAPDSVSERIETGTMNGAALLTIPAALAFHQRIGGARKEARLRALRDRWVTALRDLPQVEILTPDTARSCVAITSFRIAGKTSVAENQEIVAQLLSRHRIFTVHRSGVSSGACVRVTPALFNNFEEMDRLASAIRALV